MVFFLIFDILCLLASLGMSVMVALVITFWGSVNNELEGCVTPKTWSYQYQDQCICTKGIYTTEKWVMVKSTFIDIYPDQVWASCIPSKYIMSGYFRTMNELTLPFQNSSFLVPWPVLMLYFYIYLKNIVKQKVGLQLGNIFLKLVWQSVRKLPVFL